MRAHWICWIAVWFVCLAVFSAGEARCEIPRGQFTNPIKLFDSGAAPDSADGLTLFFNSNRGGGSGSYDIYQATRTTVNDTFGEAMNLGPDVNGPANDGKSIISFDGLTLYFRSNRGGGVGSADIWQATRATVNDAFGDVMNLGAINSAFDDRPGDISRDGLTLYFHSNRGGGEGGFDIYTATRENLSDPFGNVTNLGSGINAATGESSPSVSSDGLIMFFSDRPQGPFRRGGDGGADLWVAVRESTVQLFGDVVNLDSFSLGSDVNSPFSEWNPSISRDWPAYGSQLYFQSNSPVGDLWQATWVEHPEDCNGDLVVDIDDVNCACAARDVDLANAILSRIGSIAGDADGSGTVDFPDFLILANNFGKRRGTRYTDGDFDWNRRIEFDDFVILANNFGKSGGGVTTVVPESSSVALLGIGGFLFSLVRRRPIVSTTRGV